jgi:hypothetical protein
LALVANTNARCSGHGNSRIKGGAISEYQYYEFQAIDRPLGAVEREQLRAISSRARITATSFVNSYDWGGLKADPLKLLERYFDLFCYVANWGTRQFAMRLPKGLVDLGALKRFHLDEELALIRSAGEHVIVSINRDEADAEEWDDGSGHLAGLAPLRADLLAGDLRLFSLLSLMQLEDDRIPDEAIEPAPGLTQLSGPLAALAYFLAVNPDFLQAAVATETPPPLTDGILSFSANAASAESFRATSPPAMKEIWLRRSANWLLTGVAESNRTFVFTPAEMMSSISRW